MPFLWKKKRKKKKNRAKIISLPKNIFGKLMMYKRHLFHIRRGESISMIYVENGINSFNVLMRKYVFAFRERLLSSENVLLNTIVESIYFRSSFLFIKWKQLLYI